ncbi:hypothetical protein Ddc_21585 [Ditylenchus destructor]|nr:hypothetical protein Ddc_21585 [Ditylenchus destructor]
MTREGELQAGKSADTEVFYMAGQQLAALSRRLIAAAWAPDTPVSVVSRAGCADALSSEHDIASLGAASMLHKGRPTVVIVGAGAAPLSGAAEPAAPRPDPVNRRACRGPIWANTRPKPGARPLASGGRIGRHKP